MFLLNFTRTHKASRGEWDVSGEHLQLFSSLLLWTELSGFSISLSFVNFSFCHFLS